MSTQQPQNLLVVTGATGTQGGAVIAAFLDDKNFKLRGVTRNTGSEKAQALAAKGVEMVAADAGDVESLEKAFADATHIFALTDFFAVFTPTLDPHLAATTETAHGTNLALAASRVPTLRHYIWSTLPAHTSAAGVEVPHAASKAAVDGFIKSALADALAPKTTYMVVGFYAWNMVVPCVKPVAVPGSGAYDNETGKEKFVMPLPAAPETPVPVIGDVGTNLGPFVRGAVLDPRRTLSRYVLAATETLSLAQIGAAWGRVAGREVVYARIGLRAYEELWGAWGQELGGMVRVWEERGMGVWEGPEGEEVLGREELGVVVGEGGVLGWEESLGPFVAV